MVASEHYPIPGVEVSAKQRVCGDFDMSDQGDCVPAAAKTLDNIFASPNIMGQLLPKALGQRQEIPNIGCKKSLSTLEDDCRFNAGKVKKVQLLARSYSHWRPIRGDGNCYYRTVAFGVFETLLAANDDRRLGHIVQGFRDVHYDDHTEQLAHEHLLQHLDSQEHMWELTRSIVTDCTLDEALVRCCRRLVRLFLLRNAESLSPNGLTYSDLVRALDASYTSIEAFCERVVDPMGRDAESLVLDALPRQLGVGIRLWILDRRDEVDLVSLDTPGPAGELDVHVLFKPGHYDLLYPCAIDAQRQLEQ